MSLAKGRFGIEYDPRPRREESSGLGGLVLLILAVAAISFAFHSFNNKTKDEPPPDPSHAILEDATSAASKPLSHSNAAEAASPSAPTNTTPPALSSSPTNVLHLSPFTLGPSRPPKVRNLLLRLEEAEKQGNVEMAVSTIEQLRSLPGEPAADLDDALARRVGELNVRWLFERTNRPWVTEVVVRPGESATRIASAHGSTLASLVRLNGLSDANHIRVGQTVRVMNHPRFSLTVHRRARYADLNLNGKFFHRYDLTGEATGEVGVHPLEDATARALFKTLGLSFSLRDRVELETLLPKGATITISET